MAWSDLLQRMPRKLQLSIAIDGREIKTRQSLAAEQRERVKGVVVGDGEGFVGFDDG